jgi:hypothetical protein
LTATPLVSHPSLEAIPPASCWESHPTAVYAAFVVARRLDDEVRRDVLHDSGRRPGNIHPDTNRLARLVDTALVAVSQVQSRWPNNGAPWLVSASLRFTAGRDEEAVADLRLAAKKNPWDAQWKEARLRIAGRLEALGFPRFDALMSVQFDWSSGIVEGACRNGLIRVIKQSIVAQDNRRFDELIRLLVDLGACEWMDVRSWNSFCSLSRLGDLSGPMADRLRSCVPPAWSSPIKDLTDDMELARLRRAYFGAFSDTSLLQRLEGRDAAETRRREKVRALTDGVERPWIYCVGIGTLLSMAAVGLLALVAAYLKGEPRGRWVPCGLAGWGVFLLAAFLAYLVIFSAAHSIMNEVDTGGMSRTPPPGGKDAILQAVVSFLLVAAGTVGLVVGWRRNRANVMKNVLSGLSFWVLGYLCCVWVSAYLRQFAQQMLEWPVW